MATSSIFHNVIIKTEKEAVAFADALEKAEKIAAEEKPKSKTSKFVTATDEEIKKFMEDSK